MVGSLLICFFALFVESERILRISQTVSRPI